MGRDEKDALNAVAAAPYMKIGPLGKRTLFSFVRPLEGQAAFLRPRRFMVPASASSALKMTVLSCT